MRRFNQRNWLALWRESMWVTSAVDRSREDGAPSGSPGAKGAESKRPAAPRRTRDEGRRPRPRCAGQHCTRPNRWPEAAKYQRNNDSTAGATFSSSFGLSST
jgi:hypothetical protein